MKSISFKVFVLLFLIVVLFALFREFTHLSYKLSFVFLGPYFIWDFVRGVCYSIKGAVILPLIFLTPFFVMALFAYRCFLNPAAKRVWIILAGLITWGITVLSPFIYVSNTCSSEECLGVAVVFPFVILSLLVLLGVGLFFYFSAKKTESGFFKFFIKIVNIAIAVLLIILGLFVIVLPIYTSLNKRDTDSYIQMTASTKGPDICMYHSSPKKCLTDTALNVSQFQSYQKRDPFIFCDALEDTENQADCYYLIVQDQAQQEYSSLSYLITDSLYDDAYGSCMYSSEFDSCFREGAIKLLGDVDSKSEIKGFVELEDEFKEKSLEVCKKFNSNSEDQKVCSAKLFNDYLQWRSDWDKEFELTQRAHHIQETIDNVINGTDTPLEKVKRTKH